MTNLIKKCIFQKMMGIVSLSYKLFKTVGLLAVRLVLTELRLKTPQNKGFFNLKF